MRFFNMQYWINQCVIFRIQILRKKIIYIFYDNENISFFNQLQIYFNTIMMVQKMKLGKSLGLKQSPNSNRGPSWQWGRSLRHIVMKWNIQREMRNYRVPNCVITAVIVRLRMPRMRPKSPFWRVPCFYYGPCFVREPTVYDPRSSPDPGIVWAFDAALSETYLSGR